jgi:hemerythrin-like domain-containing protein
VGGETLEAALEREHREIDEGVEAFLAAPGDEAGTAALRRAIEALRRHIYLEEEFLFPPLRDAGMIAPVMVMLREHGEIWATMHALEAALADGAGREPASEACRELLERLDRHNMKEEAVLYPRADGALAGPAAERLGALLESGRLPDGWVCAGTRDAERG